MPDLLHPPDKQSLEVADSWHTNQLADMALPEVGARVLISQHRATVRYVGPVVGQKGVWVGVEWDDPSRGKHDGSTGGNKYFDCRSGPTAGSFIRAEKVPVGTSLIDALRIRYTNQRAEGQNICSDGEVYLVTASNRKVKVHVVGEDKVTERQSQTHLLTSARLVAAGISSPVSTKSPLSTGCINALPHRHYCIAKSLAQDSLAPLMPTTITQLWVFQHDHMISASIMSRHTCTFAVGMLRASWLTCSTTS